MQKDIEPIKESKLLKEVFRTAKLDENQVDVLVIKFEFQKTITILSQINRFSDNTKSKEKQVRPLKTEEINSSIAMLSKAYLRQQKQLRSERYETIKLN